MINPEHCGEMGMLIGAIGLPIYFHATNHIKEKIGIGKTLYAAFFGAMLGVLGGIVFVILCGIFGVKME